jgi:cytochrome c oxidase cbb3-type subunit 3
MRLISMAVFCLTVSRRKLYAMHCAVCHSDMGSGGVGIPLALPSFLGSVDDIFLRKTIRYDRPGRVMPAFPALIV